MVQTASGNQYQSTLRQLKWLVAILILSNIGLGLFGVWVLRSIDQRYSDLIGTSVPLLNDLQTLTARSVDAMRATNPALFENAPSREEVARRSRNVLQTEQAFRRRQLAAFKVANGEKERREFEVAGESFTSTALKVVDAHASGRVDEANSLREKQLRPAFDRYLVAITVAADCVEAASLRANDDFSAQTGSMSHVILGVASWPVILFLALLALTAVFVLGLMVLFRGREMGDAP